MSWVFFHWMKTPIFLCLYIILFLVCSLAYADKVSCVSSYQDHGVLPHSHASDRKNEKIKRSRSREVNGCTVANIEVVNHLSNGEYVVIDSRSHKDSQGYVGVDDSLSIPLYMIKSKSFLRGKSMVIISEEHLRNEVFSECKNIIAAGAKSVSIVFDYQTDSQGGGRVLTPEQFILLADDYRWTLQYDGEKNIDETIHRLMHSVGGGFIKTNNGYIESEEKGTRLREATLYIGDEVTSYRRGKETGVEHEIGVFYLKGGLPSLDSYLYKVNRMVAAEKNHNHFAGSCRSLQ